MKTKNKYPEKYVKLARRFVNALNKKDKYEMRIIRKECVEEFLWGKYTDDERDKFILLAFDCNDVIKDRWGEHNNYDNEFFDWLMEDDENVQE